MQGLDDARDFDQGERDWIAEAQLDASEAQVRRPTIRSISRAQAHADRRRHNRGSRTGEALPGRWPNHQAARQGGRDVIFDVPAQGLRTAPMDHPVDVHLADDPLSQRPGAWEVSLQADPVTRTFPVKIGHAICLEAMRLG